jgi:heterodisulfide reductase subunit D
MALSTARLLKAAGVDFGIMGNDERCCNSTMLRVGLKEEFMRKSKENIEVLNSTGVDIIVTSCAGCYKTLKHDYKKVGTIDAEILHSVQFFSELIEDGKLKPISPIPDRVAFHDPCHLGRHSRVFESPRDILTAIPKLDLVEMDRSRKMSRCCGAGAGVKSAFPDIATRAAEIRVSDALKVDASLLTSACPFCYQSLRDASLRMGKIEMRDLTELLIQSVSGTK